MSKPSVYLDPDNVEALRAELRHLRQENRELRKAAEWATQVCPRCGAAMEVEHRAEREDPSGWTEHDYPSVQGLADEYRVTVERVWEAIGRSPFPLWAGVGGTGEASIGPATAWHVRRELFTDSGGDS